MEEIVAADTGEVVLLRLNYALALGLEGEVPWAAAYCVLKRPGGFLLVLPAGYLPSQVLLDISGEGFRGALGPHTETSAPAVELMESGDGPAFTRPETSTFCLPTSQKRLWPAWSGTAGVEGDRGAGYVTAEELVPDQPPALGRRAKGPPLAAQQSDIMQALQALSTQVQNLASAGQAVVAPVPDDDRNSPAGPKKVSALIGAPPRPKAPPADLDGFPIDDGLGIGPIEEESQDAGGPIAAAVLAQSRALTALVAQMTSSSDPLSDLGGGSSSLSTKGSAARLKLQKELAARNGSFYERVQEAALRRMDPASGPLQVGEDAIGRSVMCRYLNDKVASETSVPGAWCSGSPNLRFAGLRPGRRGERCFSHIDDDGGPDGPRLWFSRAWLDINSPTGSTRPAILRPVKCGRLQPASVQPLIGPKVGGYCSLLCKGDGDFGIAASRSGKEAQRGTTPGSATESTRDPVSQTTKGKTMGGKEGGSAEELNRSLPKDVESADERPYIGPVCSSPPLVLPKLSPLAVNYKASSQVLGCSLQSQAGLPDDAGLGLASEPSLPTFGEAPPSATATSERPFDRLLPPCQHTTGSSTGPSDWAATCVTTSTTKPHAAPRASDASPFDGVPDFCSEFDFWSWASALPRLISASRTSFAKFLQSTFCALSRGLPVSPTALFPLPIPDLSLFGPGGPQARLKADFKYVPVDRLCLGGPLERYLGPELLLPFLEPRVLRSIPPNPLPYPDASREDAARMRELFRVWDARGLLYISTDEKAPRELTRVFGAYKSDTADRQIGDRRGANGCEDRALVWMPLMLPTVRPAFASVLEEARLVSPDVLPRHLFDPETPAYGFYQGDHAGVEYGTEAHGNLLEEGGLLLPPTRLLASRAPSRLGPWEGLIIDDYYCISSEPASADPTSSEAARRVRAAHVIYERDQAGCCFVSAATPKLLALSVISLKAAAMPAISEELASNLAGSWISALMFRRPLFAVLDGLFGLGKSSAQASRSGLRFLPRKVAQELVVLASLAPVLLSNVADPFCDRVFCSDASMNRGATCSTKVPEEVAASLWLAAEKKGCYTMLDGGAANCIPPDSDHEDGELEVAAKRPLAFDFDVLLIFEGALYLIWAGKARSIAIVFLAGLSPSQLKHRNGKGLSTEGASLIFRRSVALFKAAVRASVPAVFLYKKGAGVLATAPARNLLAVDKVLIVPPAIGAQGSLGQPGLAFCPTGFPKLFWASRSVPQAAASGLVSLLLPTASANANDRPLSPGLENIAVNEILLTGDWQIDSQWAWKRQRHINCLETEATVTKLRDIAREGQAFGVAGGIFPAYLYGPTRLNISDDPTRDVPLREPHPVRLCLLLAPVGYPREKFIKSLCCDDWRGCPRAPPARGKTDAFTIGELFDLLTCECRDRFGDKYGGSASVIASLRPRVQVVEKLASADRSVSPGFPFTAVTLLQQVKASPHSDRNHPEASFNLICPISLFSGGEVWVQSPGGAVCETIGGKKLAGELYDVACGPKVFDSRRIHFTRPWTGLRKVAVAFCVREPPKRRPDEQRRLRALGFKLPKKDHREWCIAHRAEFDFDSSLGYPGEGPPRLALFWTSVLLGCSTCLSVLSPRNPADVARAAKWSPLGLPAGRVVLPRTGSYRVDLAAAFSQWLLEPLDAEAVSDWIARYGRDLYGSGRPYWHYSETINAVTSLKPVLRRQVQAAWDLGFAWLIEEPTSHPTAIPAVILIAILSASLAWGWTREAGCFALAFGGLLRIGEVIQCKRSSLVLPSDVCDTQKYILVHIEEPKTRHKGPRHQAAKVESADLVSVIQLAFEYLQRGELFWYLSPQTLRKRLDSILKRIGASPAPHGVRELDLGSFRAGGATYILQQTEDSE
ncbi:unnamed protein product [Symbiodinium sp. CCMP2592]|nr:unnamed protein product [Symbiodinium sp. CCMP2592]